MNDKEEFLEAILRDDFPSFIAKVFEKKREKCEPNIKIFFRKEL